jgi:hypothetical protein
MQLGGDLGDLYRRLVDRLIQLHLILIGILGQIV